MELITSIFGAATIFFLLYYYFLLLRRNPTHKLPPEAGGARPILGHLHFMRDAARPPHFKLADVADQHGPFFTIRFGSRRAVVVSCKKIAKELFTACDEAVSNRAETRASKLLTYNYVSFGFSPYGRHWREQRKIVAAKLLSSRKIERMSHVSAAAISRSVKDIYSRWEEEGSCKVLVDMKKWFLDLNLNVLMMMVVGKRFDGGGDGEEMRRCREIIEEFFHYVGLFLPADAIPWLWWLDLGGFEKRMKITAEKIDRVFGEWLAEHRRNGSAGEDGEQDFMDVMVSTVRGSNQSSGEVDADILIKSTCQMMLLGGVDTSAVMLVWALSLLLNNRHVLTKAQEELDNHVGRQRRVTESDIPNLVYLQAIIKETLRLYPAAPLGTPRSFIRDCTIGQYHIPKGTWLVVNMWKMHRDPEVWSNDASEFKPERFLTTHINVDVRGQDFELIPFGAGRRSCPGTNFALRMLPLVLANLLQAFDVATVDGRAVDMTESAGLTNLKVTPLDVLVAPRLSPSLY
ncbi:cytochrome P450 CYP82D47-like [Andrographis paniculata]|uniref:cytochrome P450 CYP82D47-like n=1 Tax=Andrographis paniculata TaxID=175694 RepID=UPI0021E89FBA|nr:cytochrome P450 CYP82D47-like [Andrographis paniculata]